MGVGQRQMCGQSLKTEFFFFSKAKLTVGSQHGGSQSQPQDLSALGCFYVSNPLLEDIVKTAVFGLSRISLEIFFWFEIHS